MLNDDRYCIGSKNGNNSSSSSSSSSYYEHSKSSTTTNYQLLAKLKWNKQTNVKKKSNTKSNLLAYIKQSQLPSNAEVPIPRRMEYARRYCDVDGGRGFAGIIIASMYRLCCVCVARRQSITSGSMCEGGWRCERRRLLC